MKVLQEKTISLKGFHSSLSRVASFSRSSCDGFASIFSYVCIVLESWNKSCHLLKPVRQQSKETKLTYVCPVITFVEIEFA